MSLISVSFSLGGYAYRQISFDAQKRWALRYIDRFRKRQKYVYAPYSTFSVFRHARYVWHDSCIFSLRPFRNRMQFPCQFRPFRNSVLCKFRTSSPGDVGTIIGGMIFVYATTVPSQKINFAFRVNKVLYNLVKCCNFAILITS